MNDDKFERIVREKLGYLSRKQRVEFAWRAAMRALPCLTNLNTLEFLGKNKQHHLLAVFRCLDIAVTYARADIIDTYDASAAYYDDAADVGVAYNARATCDDDVDVDTSDIRISKAAASAARAAAKAAANANDTASYIDAAAAASHAAAAIINMVDLKETLYKDINLIKNKSHTSVDLTIYGESWHTFKRALNNEGCDYWFNYFEGIFQSEFKLNNQLKEQLNNHLTLPDSVLEEGAATAGKYLEDLFIGGSKKLNEARLIVLGDKGAGKTSITLRLMNPKAPMPREEESTAGVDTHIWGDNPDCTVHIWDFAGHTVTHAAHKFFLSERCVYLIVYDGRTDNAESLERWLEQMTNYGGESRAIILANKKDKHSLDIPINTLKSKYPIEAFETFSIEKDESKLDKFRDLVFDIIQQQPSWNKYKIGTNYYSVKEELETLFSKKDKEWINISDFEEIARKENITEKVDIDALLKSLRALGISLWYPQLKNECMNTLVLNPEWIAHGVYGIINWANNNNKYEVSISDFDSIFKETRQRFPKEQDSFLFQLLLQYEIAYEATSSKSLVIPHLLDNDQPAELPNFLDDDSLLLRYRSDSALPKDIISRFIVKAHKHIRQLSDVWRYGAVLTGEGSTIALVRQDKRRLEVSVKGSDGTQFLSELRKHVEDIFTSYKSQLAEAEYRVFYKGSIKGQQLEDKEQELWVTETDIVAHVEEGELYFDSTIRKKIDLSNCINVFNISTFNNVTAKDSNVHTGSGNQEIQYNEFSNCAINLQGSLNELADKLKKAGKADEAEEIEDASLALASIEDETDKKKIAKSSAINKIKRMVDELVDENSQLNKIIKGVKKGEVLVGEIMARYDKIASFVASISGG